MNVSFSSWLVIILAVLAANMPFLNERLLAFFPLKKSEIEFRKPILLRLIELVFLYITVALVAYFLESNIGNAFPQDWQFFAITSCLFIVFSYPGFVFQYLRKH